MYGIGQGSFKYLYTFEQVKKIYKIDTSTLRKKISREELIEGEEVKKFGGTWLITQQALIEHFGIRPIQRFIEERKPKEKVFIFSKNYSADEVGESLEIE